MATNGPYSWGNGPRPKRKGLTGLIDRLVRLATSTGKGKK